MASGTGRTRPPAGSPKACTGRPSSSTRRAFTWTDAGFRGHALADLVFYELHVGTFTAAGTFEAIIPHLPRLADARRHRHRADAGRRVPGLAQLGLRRRPSLRAAVHVRRPAGAAPARRRLPRAGPAVVLDVVYNHLGPGGQLPRRVRALLHRPLPDAVGHRGQLRRPRRRRGAPALRRERAALGPRVPPRRLPPGRHPRHLRREPRPRPQRDRRGGPRGGARWAGPSHFVAESHDNDRRIVLPPAGGLGLDAMWSDDFHHACTCA